MGPAPGAKVADATRTSVVRRLLSSKMLPLCLYALGSLCFLAGSLVSLHQLLNP